MPKGAFKVKLPEVCQRVNAQLALEHGIKASYSKIWSIVAVGGVPAVKAGTQWLMREDDIPRLVELLAPTMSRMAVEAPTKPQPTARAPVKLRPRSRRRAVQAALADIKG
jgi:hypothetical protein